jgi:hypothetical protein
MVQQVLERDLSAVLTGRREDGIWREMRLG